MSTVEQLDRRKVREPDQLYAWFHVAWIYGSILLLSFLAFAAWHYVSPWLVALIVPFLGAQIYKVTIVMHDCCHNSLFKSRDLNRLVGTVGGFFVGSQFAGFCRAHWKHHATYGDHDDPQGDDYLNLDNASRLSLAWHLVRPMFGWNLWKLFVFRRPEFDAGGEQVPQTDIVSSPYVFVLGTMLTQFVIAAIATGGFAVPWLVALYPICAATFALFYSQTRGFAEHVALPGVSPVRHARTHTPNIFDRTFFYTLNFNYHIEHHRYPNVPSCHLPLIHEHIKNDPEYGDLSPSVARTVAKRLWIRDVPNEHDSNNLR